MKPNKINIKSPIFILSLALFLIVVSLAVFVPKSTWKRIFNGGNFATAYIPDTPSGLTIATSTGTSFTPTSDLKNLVFKVYSYNDTPYGRVYSNTYTTATSTIGGMGPVTAINTTPVNGGSGYTVDSVLPLSGGSGNGYAMVKVVSTQDYTGDGHILTYHVTDPNQYW